MEGRSRPRRAGPTRPATSASWSAYHDRVEFHLVEVPGTRRARGEAYLHVRGVDELHKAWAAAGLSVSEVRDEPWEMREFNVVDPGGNLVRVGQNL
jgi:hypothetical protein